MQESQINLAIQAIASSKKLSVRRAAKIYNIPTKRTRKRLALLQSQTPHNPTEVLSQSTLVKSRIARHQGSLPTPIFETIAALAKDIELLVYANTFLTTEVHNLRKANEALSKRRRARKVLIRKEGAFSIEDGHGILE
ncbi:hypothetical protein SS1G_01615 [Sclerotinia sclerotiorum 1980 UF-70]|uniref:HTH psq-type domain-containing protein n=1 Tax=Sclerotinia sclerotiorum (strain ATCC 18683 / 1980 / Ss-1) TaxID=665079 RepID=A7E8I7_SCLS1|nr:hypothetical protein SS1G_01615 [Sclerotinia sclerotiorum 1980 UF-70]EDN96689.1 hypothetical protein SS1G_01615 [Sclerotinia sclerotiorum 1980 UF-70]